MTERKSGFHRRVSRGAAEGTEQSWLCHKVRREASVCGEFRDGGAVFAWVGGAVIDVGGEVALNGLATAYRGGIGADESDLVALGGKFVAGFLGEAIFHLQVAAIEGAFCEARGFEGGLDIHFVIGEIGDELGVSLRLIPATHDAEGYADVSSLSEGRNDGVAGTFVSGKGVGRIGIEGEERATIVQNETGIGSDDAGAEGVEVALDEGYHVAVAIDYSEIGGVVASGNFSRGNIAIGAIGVD